MSLSPAERKRAQRARAGLALTVTVELTEDEARTLAECFEVQGHFGSKKEFYAAALVRGSKFVANAGTQRGAKIR